MLVTQDENKKRNFLHLKLAIPFAIYYMSFMILLNVMGPGSSGEKLASNPVMVFCVLLYGAVLASCPWRGERQRVAERTLLLLSLC